MILDGERLKELLGSANNEVIICAPFIKLAPLRVLLEVVDVDVKLSICTRWRADEVAAGVSDLEIFDFLKDRENTTLSLLDELHAKLFVADQKCLAGSANVTSAGLGWSERPNVELVVDTERSNRDVQILLSRLATSSLATYQIKAAIEKEAAKIERPKLPEASELDGGISDWSAPWLPQCAAPERLFRVYQDPETDVVAQGTRDDARSDLSALMPPRGLSEREFYEYIAATVSRLPSVKTIIDRVPGRLNDAQGAELIDEIKPGMSVGERCKQWAIFRDWVRVFFADDIEVAPESYMMRLRSPKK